MMCFDPVRALQAALSGLLGKAVFSPAGIFGRVANAAC